ncbi:RNA-binding protein NOB1 [Hondaea fermentalgiana]|uniref:RNA-binding protein NOB1 n=1 Tax=Hondaea fermentalgiana TaxID=2315210 RepID=A0A2R5GL24_9STRA|nr:RNA-binding protein NOB1 [Hondaea fermentalgiana]|eukprot:GBG29323.1 RNA-binding protein NOB1 [Hondaea fermentalgiana]
MVTTPEDGGAAAQAASTVNADATASMEGNEEQQLSHLVVDAGAIIRLENLNNMANEFWTVREVISEIRDKNARRALETLPFDLKVREPSDEALAAVVAFAKKTGDLAVLSKPDIRIIALTYMLHKETHGVQGLRTTPLRPGTSASNASAASSASPGHSSSISTPASAADEVDGEPAPLAANEPAAPDATVASLHRHDNKVIPLKSTAVAKPGVSWAAALSKEAPREAEQVAEKPTTTSSTTTTAVPAPVSAKASGSLEPSSMWDDDDFAALDDAEDDELESPTVVPPAAPEEAWPSLGATRNAIANEEFMRTRDATEAELRKIEAKEKRKLEKRTKKQEQKMQRLREEQEAEAAAAAAAKEKEAAENPRLPDHLVGGSRILGISGVTVDSGELEGEGWVTPQNVSTLDPADAMKTLSLQGKAQDGLSAAPSKPTEAHCVACITSDYAMQNVMLQMGIRLMTMEGRAITQIRRFVLKCDSCGSICKKLDKKFCPACGNATLARLNYSISPDGALSYHYKKNRQVNTRGMRYSMPKPKGGRTGDLLLAEDQLLAGYWSQHAQNKSNSTSMFGEHVTESLGLKLSGQSDAGIRIGYGRQNPNAAKGRERRGKKKKRSEKRPGFL